LILSGTDSYSGGTVVTAGNLIVDSDTALPEGSSLTVGAGAASIFDPPLGSPLEIQAEARISSVPEPGGLALLSAAAVVAAAAWRKRKKGA
jgi:autotransporter-associated beta strand protein